MVPRSTAFRVGLLSGLLLAVASTLPAQLSFHNVEGEVVNFETPLIQPLIVTANGLYLVALNEPDGRVVVRDATTLALVAEVSAGQGLTALAERPGAPEIWISAMHSSAVMVLNTNTWRVTHVLRPPPGRPRGFGDAASPGGLAFSVDGGKAWVAATATDALVVWNAATKTWLKTVPLTVQHNGGTVAVKEPRAVVRLGNRVFVAPFKSGNQTVAGPIDLVGLYPAVIDLRKIPTLSLPDADIVALSATNESLLSPQTDVGGLIFALATDSLNGKLVAASVDAQNATFLGEGAFPKGRVTLNRLTFVTPGGAPSGYTRIALEDLPGAGGPVNVAMPAAIAIDASGRIYVAGYGSNNIGVFTSAGGFVGSLPTDAGPRGLAVDPSRQHLYCYNRIAGTITTYDVSGALPPGPSDSVAIGAYDPTYDRVRQGRALFNDAANSGGGSTSCFSCHPDLEEDGMGWDLSAYFDLGDGFTPANPPRFWRDRKFAMTSQDCRSLEDSAPYHWRGEQKDLEGFNGAFGNLLKGAPLTPEDFGLLKAYTFSAVYPSNPLEALDRIMSPLATAGIDVFLNRERPSSPVKCNDCHTLPTGSRGALSSGFVTGKVQPAGRLLRTMDTPQLRGMWTKQSASVDVVNDPGTSVLVPVTGFGFDHTGSHRNTDQFIDRQFSDLSAADRDGLKALMNEFDSGLAPCTAYSEHLDQATAPNFLGATYLVDQANRDYCDVTASGRIDLGNGWREVGLVFDRDLQAFRTDDAQLAALTMNELVQRAAAGQAELLFLGTPLGSGERVGVDRDRDHLANADELRLGSDPARADTDGDGVWDGEDAAPLDPGTGSNAVDPPQVLDLRVTLVTANAMRLSWRTDTLSPTHVIYGETLSYGQEVGDPLPLPAGSNEWKRLHTVVLRGLEDDTSYHYQVLTEGQNGMLGGSTDATVTTLSDATLEVPETSRVADIQVTAQDLGAVKRFTAEVTVVSNSLLPVPSAEVRGFWTLFLAGQPLIQLDGVVGLTDGAGVATIVTDLDPQQTQADRVTFTVPMYLGPPDNAQPGVLDTVLGDLRSFAWSDSVVTTAGADVP